MAVALQPQLLQSSQDQAAMAGHPTGAARQRGTLLAEADQFPLIYSKHQIVLEHTHTYLK